jgi:ribosomal protein S17E
MGKIKTRLIKRTTKGINKKDIPFSENFGANKKILGKEMPSKKVRNQIAGFLSRVKKQERKALEKLEKGLKKE